MPSPLSAVLETVAVFHWELLVDLGISETSHNKLCSVRKGADAMKKQMLHSEMGLSRPAEAPAR